MLPNEKGMLPNEKGMLPNEKGMLPNEKGIFDVKLPFSLIKTALLVNCLTKKGNNCHSWLKYTPFSLPK